MSVIENFSAHFKSGETVSFREMRLLDIGVTGLFGESGVGKTTLLNALCGWVPEAKYQWIWRGQRWDLVAFQERGIAFVPQGHLVFSGLTARNAIDLLFSGRGRKSLQWKEVELLMEELGVAALANKPLNQTSAGQRLKLSVVAALASAPQILLLDEPFANLDEDSKKIVQRCLMGWIQKFGITCLLVSHDRSDLQTMTSHVYELTASNGALLNHTP